MDKLTTFLDKYDREARFYPTVLACLPILILFYSIQGSVSSLSLYLKILSSSILWIIFSYLLTEVTRSLGKNLEIKIFDNELTFPTTELLLHSNTTFSQEKKEKIYNKIREDFGVSLLNQSQEKSDDKLARKKIIEVVGQIRQKVNKGRLLLYYNIRYGFWRNLIAASPIASIVGIISAFVLVAFLNDIFSGILILFVCLIYLVLWISTKPLLIYFSRQYANQFFLEYLAN